MDHHQQYHHLFLRELMLSIIRTLKTSQELVIQTVIRHCGGCIRCHSPSFVLKFKNHISKCLRVKQKQTKTEIAPCDLFTHQYIALHCSAL